MLDITFLVKGCRIVARLLPDKIIVINSMKDTQYYRAIKNPSVYTCIHRVVRNWHDHLKPGGETFARPQWRPRPKAHHHHGGWLVLDGEAAIAFWINETKTITSSHSTAVHPTELPSSHDRTNNLLTVVCPTTPTNTTRPPCPFRLPLHSPPPPLRLQHRSSLAQPPRDPSSKRTLPCSGTHDRSFEVIPWYGSGIPATLHLPLKERPRTVVRMPLDCWPHPSSCWLLWGHG